MRRVSLIIFFLLSLSLFADEVRVEPLEFWQQASLWGDSLTVDQIAEASLRASGLDGEDLKGAEDLLAEKIRALESRFNPLKDSLSSAELAEDILNWMHREVLTGRYIFNQTRLDILIDEGDYNCVSSALFYMLLTRSLGLDVRGEETVDHAFCTLNLPDQAVDIETTTIMGFDPGTKKEFGDNFSGRTGFAYVEPGDYRRRQPASDKEMIALILQNRIALLQQKRQYDQALSLTIDRWFFLPTDQNRRDMNDGIGNYVAQLNERGRYSEALSFLLPLVRELDLIDLNGDLIETLITNQIIEFTNGRRVEEADQFLSQWQDLVSDDQQRVLRNMIDQSFIDRVMAEGNYTESLAAVRLYGEQGRITQARRDELLTFLHQNEAIDRINRLGSDRPETFLAVVNFFESLPESEKTLPGVLSHSKRYLGNWAILIHNRFADLYNMGDFDEANTLLTEALIVDSDNSLLLKDLSLLEQKR